MLQNDKHTDKYKTVSLLLKLRIIKYTGDNDTIAKKTLSGHLRIL